MRGGEGMSKVVDLKAKVKTKRRLSEATKYEFACTFAEFYKTWKKEREKEET